MSNNKNMKEKISALADGELSDFETSLHHPQYHLQLSDRVQKPEGVHGEARLLLQ